jgi:Protein of unknown function (DUF2911)
MKKLIWISLVIVVVIIGSLAYYRFYTKSFSPESDVYFASEGLKIHVNYSRPFKRGRIIFGGLEPYGKIWRTGANEATCFETNKDLKFGDKVLPAGTYSLWAIPREKNWTIIFNTEYGQWGVNYNKMANKDPKNDVLSVEAPVRVVSDDKAFEQFTIAVEKADEDMEIILAWDKTLVALPFSK